MSIDYSRYKLRGILGGVFHNAWPEEYGNWENAIADAFNRNSIDTLLIVKKELESIVKAGHSESELNKIIFRDLAANYYPAGDNLTCQEWLGLVAKAADKWIRNKKLKKPKR